MKIAADKRKIRPESVDCTPPDFIMPRCKERLIFPLQPQAKEHKGPQCIKVGNLLHFLFFGKFFCLLSIYKSRGLKTKPVRVLPSTDTHTNIEHF